MKPDVQNSTPDPTPADPTPADPTPADQRLADQRLATAFRVLIVLGLGLILLGSILQLITHGQLQPELIAPQHLAKSLLALQPQALTTLGFATVILGPAAGLLVLIWTFARQNERLAPLVALLVFTIIIMSIPIEQWVKHLTGGG